MQCDDVSRSFAVALLTRLLMQADVILLGEILTPDFVKQFIPQTVDLDILTIGISCAYL